MFSNIIYVFFTAEAVTWTRIQILCGIRDGVFPAYYRFPSKIDSSVEGLKVSEDINATVAVRLTNLAVGTQLFFLFQFNSSHICCNPFLGFKTFKLNYEYCVGRIETNKTWALREPCSTFQKFSLSRHTLRFFPGSSSINCRAMSLHWAADCGLDASHSHLLVNKELNLSADWRRPLWQNLNEKNLGTCPRSGCTRSLALHESLS